jgi:hypothetical protein
MYDDSISVFYGCDGQDVMDGNYECVDYVAEAILNETSSGPMRYDLLLAGCDSHVIMTRDIWGDQPVVEDVTLLTMVDSVLEAILESHDTGEAVEYTHIFDCDSFDCNPTCPESGWGRSETPVGPDEEWIPPED